MPSFSIVVLCSGRGSNLQALIDAAASGSLPIDIRAVVSDKPTCRALERARAAGIATVALQPRDFAARSDFDRTLFARAAEFAPDLIVLAGYMRIIDAAVVGAWRGRMINIHPSLLPKYAGLDTHRRAIDAGDAMHGASVHFVTAELDGGPVIAQTQLPIAADDDASSLAKRLLPLEHRLLVAALGLIVRGEVAFEADRTIHNGLALTAPLVLDADGRLRTHRD